MKNRLFTLVTLLLSELAMAQTAVTNTGILKISTGSTFYAGGNFTNNSSSSLTNNGNLYVKGNVSNGQASMSIGSGDLHLNGTSAQTVSGTQKFNTFDLETNNSSGITLNNDLSVSGTHTFTAGLVSTSATPNYLIYEAGSSYTGANDSKHVNGWVKKTGGTNFTFPVGNNSYLRAISLNISSSSEFNVRYYIVNPTTSPVSVPLVVVDPNEYWMLNQVSGGSSTVAMNWDNPKVAFPNWQIADIKTSSYDGSKWVSEGGTATGNSTTQGNITSASATFNRAFTLGSVHFPLPLTLVSFTARYTGTSTTLSWTTVDEENVDHFIVERSDDGTNFYAITELPARNTGNKETYSTSDYKPISRAAYYRLRMVDIDAKEKMSRIVVVTVGNKNMDLTLLANPVHDKLSLFASSSVNGNFHYSITSMNGQLMQQDELNIARGIKFELPLRSDLSPGVYNLEIKNISQSFLFTFIRQ